MSHSAPAAPGRLDTECIKAAAILLVIYSHLHAFLPDPRLATGGALGNSLFFVVSGYGVAKSLLRSGAGFGAYYARRVAVIHPTVIVSALLVALPLDLVLGDVASASPLDFLRQFFWPNYWFLQAILAFYVPVYFAARDATGRTGWALAAALAGCYAWAYAGLDLSQWSVESTFATKLPVYLLVMLAGVLAARRELPGASPWPRLAAALACAALIYLQKVMFGRVELLQTHQYLQQLLLLPFAYCALTGTVALFGRGAALPGALRAVAGFLAAHTLSLFIVHVNLLRVRPLAGLAFPVNVLLFLALSLALAALVTRLAGSLSARLKA